MNESHALQAARARGKRRKRMQQRQTVIFGSIIAVLLGMTLFAGGVWAGLIPPPFEIALKSPEDERGPLPDQPCPPEGAHAVPLEELAVNILNSTQTAGLGGRTAEDIQDLGITVESVGNAGELFLGGAKIVTGFDTIAAAYTVADLVPESAIFVDERTEDVIDIVIGSSFTEVRKAEELKLSPGEEIPAPEGCIVVEGTQGDPSDADLEKGDSEAEGE